MPPKRGNEKSKRKSEGKKPQKSLVDAKNDRSDGSESTNGISLDLQQKLVNIFRDAFPVSAQSDLSSTLQDIKGHLYKRDFAKAFGCEEHLEAYALRWSPSRALCYTSIFNDVLPLVQQHHKLSEVIVLCIGGGAGAEIVGLAGALYLQRTTSRDVEPTSTADTRQLQSLAMHAIDIADWSILVQNLSLAASSAPPLSQYASAAAKAANSPLVDANSFQAEFEHVDVLSLTSEAVQNMLKGVQLITIMFTLNELYSTSLSKTQTFLQQITEMATSGVYLLVLDSPGSYSTVSLNGKDKQYPMSWLMDYTLIGEQESNSDKQATNQRWEKLRTEQSTWFRLLDGLNYPIQLENMRYQLHLYRRN